MGFSPPGVKGWQKLGTNTGARTLMVTLVVANAMSMRVRIMSMELNEPGREWRRRRIAMLRMMLKIAVAGWAKAQDNEYREFHLPCSS